ncbi:hypothetical protein [Aneurinibacillus migulanus]|uniref:hypothetical protein n=1 Tax=Aneurinibacillus migulanus TaxID=47500 RepID=UPI000ABCD2E6|nr:hypothetical protein [Aneurinibacillus migulanus]
MFPAAFYFLRSVIPPVDSAIDDWLSDSPLLTATECFARAILWGTEEGEKRFIKAYSQE